MEYHILCKKRRGLGSLTDELRSLCGILTDWYNTIGLRDLDYSYTPPRSVCGECLLLAMAEPEKAEETFSLWR